MSAVKVGIAGLGTVGQGALNILRNNAEEIARRAGFPIDVVHIATRRAPDIEVGDIRISTDVMALATDPAVQVVVELIGGTSTARELVEAAIRNGKHIVTANKALIAEHGNEILALANEYQVDVAFEAAVAGGVPILKSLAEGLAANRVQRVAGIINGTGNFILSEMRDKGRDFADVLAEAQALGYAEADPTFDVEGIDAAHKLTILASIAFGIPLQFSRVYTEGITRLTREDVEAAEQFGYRIKHLGIAKRTAAGVELRVHPTLIAQSVLLASVNGVMNAVMVDGDAVGPTLFYGAGAGAGPTGSAVVADIIEIARTLKLDVADRAPALGFHLQALADIPVLPMEQVVCPFYIRLHVQDRTGVLADITRILADNQISIEAMFQKDVDEGEPVPVMLMTHSVPEASINRALEAIGKLDAVLPDIARIRVELLQA